MTAWTDRSGSIADLAAAWVAAAGEMDDVPRTREVKAGPIRYSYADLGDALSMARPILAKHSLLLTQSVECDDRDVMVTTTMLHASGQFVSTAPVRMPLGKTAQNTGSSITYARRYALMAFLGLATDDDDGASASPREQAPPPRKVAEPRTSEEAKIRDMIRTGHAQRVHTMRGAFVDEFGCNLSELEPSLHPAALAFVEQFLADGEG